MRCVAEHKLCGTLALAALLLTGCATPASSDRRSLSPSAEPRPVLTPVAARVIQDPADYAAPTCQHHLPSETGQRAFYGVRVNNCLAPDGGKGVFVVRFFLLNGESPAERAGVEKGDQILSMKGCTVNSAGEVRLQIEETAPGSTAFVKVRKRNGAVQSVPVRTGVFTPTGGDAPGRAAGENLCRTVGLRPD